ncbi:hypothetical protein Asppvi_005088 [Aspergillus pseudoviridinutans]|uniref:Apple domain-containing protein n=1 Tax=Aspergillus pseudoviridinutans TaxID=1517512 RepID=A0A9P3B7M6_9EURO|nr:uncharacterized protein Asppvi_005088 [Aspergillus pseudoviridinutans]GIJ86206.1 hypothetical protein Asppvi_005088 [Aspergillus pseudoviridinutans]
MGLPTLYNSILVFLLFAPAWSNGLARANYSDFCPAGNPEIQVDSTSYTITCDRSYMVPLPIRVRDNATPADCARVCTADPECHGIVWHAGNCWQSNHADATTGTAAGAILLVPGETQEPVPEPVPNCQEQVDAAVATANTNCANQLETQLRNSDEIAANCDYGQTAYIRTIAGVRFRPMDLVTQYRLGECRPSKGSPP